MHLVATRRHAAAALALIALAALAVTATAAHWPMFGGDAGHSGNQPVDEGTLPVKQRYAQVDVTEQNVKTSVVATAGGRLAYGTHVAAGNARAHVQNLSDGTPVGDQAGADVDSDPVADTDTFTGNGGSVTPVDTSTAGDAGVALFLHNDDNQEGGAADDPRTGGDIALAAVDTSTGAVLFDKTIGPQDPAADDETINMRVSGSPVLGPVLVGTPSSRDLFFVAEREAASVGPPDFICDPTIPFDQEDIVQGCDVPAERWLFKVTISNPGTPSAAIVPSATKSVLVPTANLASSPSIVRLTSGAGPHTFVAIGTDDGFVQTFDTADLTPGPESGDLGDAVSTPVVPVRSDGAPADTDPPIYVTVATAGGFKAYEVRRLDPVPAAGPKLGLVDPTRDQSAVTPGTPGVAGAVGALADQMPAGGRYVVPAGSNLYSFDVNDLRNADAMDLTGLTPGETGFSRTVPAMSGGLVYIARDNGEQLVLDETSLDAAPGFVTFPDNDGRAAGDGVGQPAISLGFVAFGQQDGLFAYRNENAPTVVLTAPTAGSTLSGAVTLRATAYNLRSGVSSLRFLLNDVEVGKGVLVSGSPTSSASPGVYELSLDSRQFGNGNYWLTAEATDADTGIDAPTETALSEARQVTIANQAPTQLSVGDVEVTEGDAGTREATFTVTKTGPGATSVTVSTKDVSATAGLDYDAVSTSLTFAAGDGARTVAVPIRGDTVDEPDETFTVTLSDPTGGAGVADGAGLGIIRDDDATLGPNDPVVSVSSASVAEGPTGRTRKMTFDVSLSRPVGVPVTAAFATVDQSAHAPADYRATTGTVTFAAGQLTARFSVTVVGDGLVEGDEAFLVRLSDVKGAGLGNATGTGQIVDDEVAAANRKRPTLSLRIKPSRDRKSPFRFTATGRLGVPAGVSALAACQGRVAVQVKAGRKTISNRRVQVRSNCTFRSPVTFRGRARFSRNGKLGFRARFLGNGLLRPRASREVVARTR